MTTALQYAKALRSLVEENPNEGALFLNSLREALARRGHGKLFPYILREYQKLELKAARSASARTPTPERERTRMLYELYKKLANSH